MLAQPDFEAGRFHTTYLDELLKTRNGAPFAAPSPDDQEVAAIAAALHALLAPATSAAVNGNGAPPPSNGRWKSQARIEGLR
jgi:hypothetical protein